MKDFEKTIAFVRDFDSFRDIIPELWNGKGAQGADFLINKMREYKDSTRLKGEELANEVKEVCPELSQLQPYYEMWCRLLAKIPTSFIGDDELSDETQWACRLDDDDKGCMVAGFIRKMAANYADIMDGKRWLETTYSLTPYEAEAGEQRTPIVPGHTATIVDDGRTWELDTSGMTCYSSQMKMPLTKIHTFLINENVIPNDTPLEYFVKSVRCAYLKGLYERSEKRIKLHRTFDEIRKKYYSKNAEYVDSLVLSVGKDPRNPKDRAFMTKGNITDDFINRLRELL